MDDAERAKRTIADRLTDREFPNKAGVMGTHWDGCVHAHSECAFHAGVMAGLNYISPPCLPFTVADSRPIEEREHDKLLEKGAVAERFANCRDRCEQAGLGRCACA